MRKNYSNSFLIFQFTIFILHFYFGCEKDFTPIGNNTEIIKPESKLHLEVIDTDVQHVWLHLSIDSSFSADTIEINRNEKIIYRDTMMVRDTVIYDDYVSINPAPVYYYNAYARQDGKKIQITDSIEAHMLPVTSHDFIWEIDTIGTWQSSIDAIWGTSPDNVYAVGSFDDPFPGYRALSIIHWNGNEWAPIDYFEGFFNSIYGFSEDDIWVAGSYGSHTGIIGHFDGNNWRSWKTNYPVLREIWGTSSSNMYAVGKTGTILHYDGTTWSQMQSGTTHLLYDIWGTSENDIYITGFTDATGEGILLKLNDGIWETIYDGYIIQGVPLSGRATTIWGMNAYKYYLFTTSVALSIGYQNNFEWYNHGFPNDNSEIIKIRGSDYNNIFAIGAFGLIIHFDGQSFHRFDQFYKKPYGDVFYGIWCFEDDVFIGGMSEVGTAIIYRGKK